VTRVAVNGTELHVEDTGGPGETILFSHGLLWNTSLFAPQVAALRDRYRCVAYGPNLQRCYRLPPAKVHAPDQIVGNFAILRVLNNLPNVLTIDAWTQSETPLRPAPAPRLRNSQVAMTFEKRFALL